MSRQNNAKQTAWPRIRTDFHGLSCARTAKSCDLKSRLFFLEINFPGQPRTRASGFHERTSHVSQSRRDMEHPNSVLGSDVPTLLSKYHLYQRQVFAEEACGMGIRYVLRLAVALGEFDVGLACVVDRTFVRRLAFEKERWG